MVILFQNFKTVSCKFIHITLTKLRKLLEQLIMLSNNTGLSGPLDQVIMVPIPVKSRAVRGLKPGLYQNTPTIMNKHLFSGETQEPALSHQLGHFRDVYFTR